MQNVLGSFGRSSARRYQPSGDRVTFADVAGIEEAKEELTEVVDFLRHPEKYRKLGGRIPHGVLLSGPPGTGKTLLARAVAGEADVPFFSMAASEFVEAIVGVGASRVRDLFKQAKEAAPAIVFIDELDAIGRSRTSGVAGFSGGNDEREQTLNQILTEMDGFDSSTSVIVIGATNRPEVLDQALLRPGRFDRRVAVQPPDRTGREAILKVHARGVPLDPDVDLDRIAATTPGHGRRRPRQPRQRGRAAGRPPRPRAAVTEADFTDALERIVLGAERQVMIEPRGPSPHRLPRGRPRHRRHAHRRAPTPCARSRSSRAAWPSASPSPRPTATASTTSSPRSRAKIKVALGGRAAEEVVFGEISTGAESDIQQLTDIARQMVGRWGMSDGHRPGRRAPARRQRAASCPARAEISPDTQARRRRGAPHRRRGPPRGRSTLLQDNRDKLDALAPRCSSTRRWTRRTPTRPPASPAAPGSGRAVSRRRAG